MEVEVLKTVTTEKMIKVELPYYFKRRLNYSIIYGKIGDNKKTSIQITHDYTTNSDVYELEIEEGSAQSNACYFVEEYKGTKEEYLAAKLEMLEELSRA
jgi:hypothetical protein